MMKNLISGSTFGTQFFFVSFSSTSYIIPSYHPMQNTGKLMNQTWEDVAKPNLGPKIGAP